MFPFDPCRESTAGIRKRLLTPGSWLLATPLARVATSARGRVALVPLALVGAVLSCAYASTVAPGVTWANDGADSGDLIAATATLGVAHPTGYST